MMPKMAAPKPPKMPKSPPTPPVDAQIPSNAGRSAQSTDAVNKYQ